MQSSLQNWAPARNSRIANFGEIGGFAEIGRQELRPGGSASNFVFGGAYYGNLARFCLFTLPATRWECAMAKVTTFVLTAVSILSSTTAFAQGTASTSGTYIGPYTQSFTVPNFGINTTPSSTAGLGNGSNPGIGDRSDPSIRANTGLDANGPCNGARSTAGNNTPSC